MISAAKEQASGRGIGADSSRARSATVKARHCAGAAPAPVEQLRRDIERIDRAIVDLIAERMQVANAIGSAKRAAGVPVVDPAREAAIVRRAGDHARTAGVPEEDVRDVFWRLVALSRRVQLETMNGAA